MRALCCLLFFLAASAACASDINLPSRSQWRASSSSTTTPAMAPAHAIDGDLTTRWGGGFSPGNWFQVDLGRAADVGRVIIRWDYGAAKAYSIEDSIDGQHWHTAFETRYMFRLSPRRRLAPTRVFASSCAMARIPLR